MPKKDKIDREPMYKRIRRLIERIAGFFPCFRMRDGVTKRSLLVPVLSGICLLGLAIWGIVVLCTIPDVEIGPEVGNRAPDFTLQTIYGDSITLSDFRGKIVLLSFMSIDDSLPDDELGREADSIQAVRNKWSHEELEILIIGIRQDHAEVQNYITRYGLTYPVLPDSGKVHVDYDVMHDGINFYIDDKGIIRLITYSHLHNQGEIENILNSMANDRERDSILPVISGVSVSDITDRSAVIAWVTDEPATSDAIVHDENDICIGIQPDDSLVTSHRLIVDHLDSSTNYHFQVLSGYSLESQAPSKKYLFTTLASDVSPPDIWDVTVSGITESSATIEWGTEIPTISEVEYWITASGDSVTVLDDELTANHSVGLSGLQPGTTYHFRIKSKDTSANEAISEADHAFETLPAASIGLEIGDRAPDFTLSTIGGESVTLSDFRGKVVMAHFWMKSCGACRREMPHIQAVFDSWSDEELVILAVHVRSSAVSVRSFVRGGRFTFPVLLDPEGEVSEDYQVFHFPTTFFIDDEGIIVATKEGSFSNQTEIEDVLNSF